MSWISIKSYLGLIFNGLSNYDWRGSDMTQLESHKAINIGHAAAFSIINSASNILCPQ